MARERLEAARELLREKRYDEARAILETLDHPTARKWLRQLDARSPHPSAGFGLVITALVGIAALLVGIVIGAMAFPRRETATVQETVVVQDVQRVPETVVVTEVPLPTVQATPLPAISGGNAGGWQYREDRSIIDDTVSLALILDADMPVSTWLSTTTPSIIVRCREPLLEIYINAGTSFDSDVELDGTAFVRLRWDAEQADVFQMNESSDGEAVFFDDAHATLRQMLAHEKLIFGFNPYNTVEQATSFTLSGLRQALQPMIEPCNLSADGV